MDGEGGGDCLFICLFFVLQVLGKRRTANSTTFILRCFRSLQQQSFWCQVPCVSYSQASEVTRSRAPALYNLPLVTVIPLEYSCILFLLMGRPLYSLRYQEPPPSFSPELQEVIHLRELLLQELGLSQSVRWSSTLANWWNVSLLLPVYLTDVY